MTRLTLYTNPMSRGRIARWMLEEIGAPYDVEVIAYGPALRSAEYLAVNPMGKVPALKHGETVVTECAAICAYLADAFPEAKLAPSVQSRGAYYRWMFFAAGPLEAAVTNHSLGFQAKPGQERMLGYGSYGLVLETLAAALSQTPFIAGDRFTAADVYVGSHLIWGMQFGSIAPRPVFEDYTGRLTSREAAKRANQLDDALAAEQQGAAASSAG
ncbi:glutathione S-transferase family protein [Rhizobium oryzicola]|uniref:Glutathione S-transferase family protein n=1 Tax=Rhizobium oryzicola TaxID=1232668 RepID=A0ABT8T3A0_9HYPH|nr:glutathione S-transferase family protein [Rhizobium oryzicola]MDO1585117.1 glutathione S-transferase family protein [Rhizobium oryzicola]